jgi:hypothetical protein
MPINGIELAVGQAWRTRKGEEVILEAFHADEALCWSLSSGHRVNDLGRFWATSRHDSEFDLVEFRLCAPGSANEPAWLNSVCDKYASAWRQALVDGVPGAAAQMVIGLSAPVGDLASTAKVTNPKDAIGNIKLPLHLWPAEASALGSLGMLEGECKYGRNNYIAGDGVIASIYVDAAKRHLDAWFAGEENAPDTGTPHLANALASIAIIVKARAHERLIDDRDFSPSPGYRKLVDEITPHVARIKTMFADKSPRHFTIVDNKEAA